MNPSKVQLKSSHRYIHKKKNSTIKDNYWADGVTDSAYNQKVMGPNPRLGAKTV